MLKVVVFSGGRGSNTIAQELLKDPSIKLSLIVNAYDDGKSTGEIRKFFNMLGPSDIRKNQENLMSTDFPHYDTWAKIFEFRFPKDIKHEYCIKTIKDFIEGKTNAIENIEIEDTQLKRLIKKLLRQFVTSLEIYEKQLGKKFNFSDCSLSNCLYSGAYEILDKNFNKTIELFNILLHTRGEVIPTNLENKKLIAIRENGDICYNEAQIVELRSNDRIEDIFLIDDYLNEELIESNFTTMEQKKDYLHRIESYVQGTPEVIKALENADIILYAPGTQHSSLYPSYTTLKIPEAIYRNKKALKIFVCNIGEDYETPGFTASEFITSAYKYLNKNTKGKVALKELIDVALVNTSRSKVKEDFHYVDNDNERLDKLPIDIVYGDYESHEDLGKHDAITTVRAVKDIYYKKFFKGFFSESINFHKEYVIFDFDGTIADTNTLHAAAFHEVFESIHIHDFKYEDYMGRKTVEVFKDFLKSRDLPYTSKEIESLTALKQSTVRKLMLSQLKAYDGAIEVIRYLKAIGTTLIITTSSSRKGVHLALRQLGLLDSFDYIITGDDVEKAKPSPEIYFKTLQLAHIQPEEAIVIEDSIHGAKAAQEANLQVVIVNNDQLSDQFYCTSFQEILMDLKAGDGGLREMEILLSS